MIDNYESFLEKRNDKNKKSFTVAITGGIGSGKTFAANVLENLGYEVVSADVIGHDLLMKNEVKLELTSIFGDVILTDYEIDRRKLGNIVFDDPVKLSQLNKVLHPRILEIIIDAIETYWYEVIFFDIPLLFETDIQDLFDLTVNISAEIKYRMTRIVTRDNTTEEDVQRRMDNQLPDEIKRQKAHLTIENNHTPECFLEKIHLLADMIAYMTKKSI